MSLKFAENEKVFACYDYATYGYRKKLSRYSVAKSLIVTNKRVVHQEVSEQLGRELIVRKEIPLEHARFVDVSMSHAARFPLLVWTIITAVLSLVAFLFPAKEKLLPSMPIVFSIVGCVFAFVALILLICFLTSLRTYLACSIDVDCRIENAFDFNSQTVVHNPKRDLRTKKRMQINVSVNKKVARQMADELGATILEAMAYVPEQKEPTPEARDAALEKIEEELPQGDPFAEVAPMNEDDPFAWNANAEAVTEEPETPTEETLKTSFD